MGDTRGVPLTVASTDGLRRVVGRVITDKNYNPINILIDDPDVMKKMIDSRLEEGSFQMNVGT